MNNLQGKTALVTGASSGIGLALAHSLAARGANLILTARSEDKLLSLAKDLQEKGTSVHVFVQDLSEQQAASRLYDQIAQAGLTIDLLINNAGFGIWGGFEETPLTEYSRMLQVNINALTELCHLFIPNMIKQKESGIINVASTAAFVPIPFAAAYSASKSYVLMLTEALHGEYNQHGLQAMTLCPGGTASNFAAVTGGKDNTRGHAP